MDSSRLVYEPLTSSTSIRLLRLYAGNDDEPIKCAMHPHKLENAPRYTALSYEWSGDKARVQVNDGCHWIQTNLHTFLNTLRSTLFLPIMLWVDAICINQNDIDERNQQVQLMRKIYLRADKVISWLGPSEFATDMAMAFCNSAIWKNNDSVMPNQHSNLAIKGCFGEWVANLRATRGEESQESVVAEMFDHFQVVSKRRYWSRAWIVPEVLLASQLQILIGSSSTDWASFEAAIDFLLPRCDCDAADLEIWPLIKVRRELATRATVALPTLISTFGSKKCQYIVDRVYALIGIYAYDKDVMPITVNYNAPTERLFIDTLHYGLQGQNDSNPDAIVYCQKLQKALALSPRGCLINVLPLQERLVKQPCTWKMELFTPKYQESLLFVSRVGRPLRASFSDSRMQAFTLEERGIMLMTKAPIRPSDIVYQVSKTRVAIICKESTGQRTDQGVAIYTTGVGALVPSLSALGQIPHVYFDHQLKRPFATGDLSIVLLSLLDVIVFASLPMAG